MLTKEQAREILDKLICDKEPIFEHVSVMPAMVYCDALEAVAIELVIHSKHLEGILKWDEVDNGVKELFDAAIAERDAAESRAQEAETKLRAAEDAVVVLREALLAEQRSLKLCKGLDLLADSRAALTDTAALAAQRKREIQREALRDYGHHMQAIPELGVEGCDYDPEQGIPCTCGLAAILGEKENN